MVSITGSSVNTFNDVFFVRWITKTSLEIYPPLKVLYIVMFLKNLTGKWEEDVNPCSYISQEHVWWFDSLLWRESNGHGNFFYFWRYNNVRGTTIITLKVEDMHLVIWKVESMCSVRESVEEDTLIISKVWKTWTLVIDRVWHVH